MRYLISFVLIILIICTRQVNQHQRGLIFQNGIYIRSVKPGWRIVYPFIQKLVKIDMTNQALKNATDPNRLSQYTTLSFVQSLIKQHTT